MGVCFDRLNKDERAVVAEHVRAEYDKLLFQQPTTYMAKHAQADPEGGHDAMCELIAADPKRLQEIVEKAGKGAGGYTGFTLMEMAIVLVIIGLIVGGVLVGQDLIKAAQIRNAVTQLHALSAAVNTFRVKYDCVPGDCANATQFFGNAYQTGFDSLGNPCTGNGDGNGYIDHWPCESIQALQGLTAAGLMSHLAAQSVYDRGGGTGWSYFTSFNNDGAYFYSTDLYGATQRLGTTVSWAKVNGCANAGALTPTQAQQIDLKIDDGLPNSGSFMGLDAANGTTPCTVVPASCVTAGVNSYLSSNITGCRTIYFLE